MEYKNYLPKSFGRLRKDMPQIQSEDLDQILLHFAPKVTVKKVKRKLSDLKPSQVDIDDFKVKSRYENGDKNHESRIYIISKDNYIVDGHHDWAIGLENDPDMEVDCYRIGIPIGELLKRTNQLKFTTKIQSDEIKKAIIEGDEIKCISLLKAHIDYDELCEEYNEWNSSGGGYKKVTEYSVREFLENNHEDYLVDDILTTLLGKLKKKN